MEKVILKTAGMYDGCEQQEPDYELWKSISNYMDGETALVKESGAKNGKYVFLGLVDEKKNKELFYMMEQDSMMGTYVDDRTSFEEAWEKGKYEPEGCFYLEKKHIEFPKATIKIREERLMEKVVQEKKK